MMNETPPHITMTAPSIFKAPQKDGSAAVFQSPPKECRDDVSFLSPIEMNRDNGSKATEEECNTSFPQDDDDNIAISSPVQQVNEVVVETEQQRLQREQLESENLARQLMAEEAMASYAASSDFLRVNSHQFSQEDLAALQAAMEDEEEEEGELSYDALLQLGDQIGNVKEERWALVAQNKIDSIPVVKFTKAMGEGKDENHTHVKCLICQFPYEEQDELRQLECGHAFHKECVDEWLSGKDCCAFCRKSIC